MKAIFASKLYTASSAERQNRICAALANPVNTELVQQLRSYLDDEYLDNKYLNPEESLDEAATTSNDVDNIDQDSEASEGSSHSSSPSHSTGSGSHSNVFDNLPGGMSVEYLDEDSATEVIDESEPIDDVEDADESVEESTNIHADTDLMYKLPEIVNEIREALNSRQDTCGVNRILKKANELWIHYDDKINLNSVMGAVIEFLNAAGYTYLEFNRLARSENAIVFQIESIDADIEPSEVDNIET